MSVLNPLDVFLAENKAKIESSLRSHQFTQFPPTELKHYLQTTPTFSKIELCLERAAVTECDPFDRSLGRLDPDYLVDCILSSSDTDFLLDNGRLLAEFVDDPRVTVSENIPEETEAEQQKMASFRARFPKAPISDYVLVIKSHYSTTFLERRRKLLNKD